MFKRKQKEKPDQRLCNREMKSEPTDREALVAKNWQDIQDGPLYISGKVTEYPY